MFLFEILYIAGIIYLTITISWLALLTAGSWLHSNSADRAAPLLNLGVLIPAHNEELQLTTTLNHIRSCDYPEELLHIMVIADNCTDSTAEMTRQAGITVIERHNREKSGKGQAIDWFLRHHKHLYKNLDAVCFVDADVHPDQMMFKELSASLAANGVEVVQGFNGVSNPLDNWRTALNTVAFNVFNHVRMAGNHALFGSGTLKGLGMAFRTSLLLKYGWPAHSVVEDMEFTLMLLRNKIKVNYNPRAIITSEMTGNRRQADIQRNRWEGGRFRLALKVLPELLLKIVTGRFRYIPLCMDLIVAPLSLLAAQLSFWTTATFFFFPELLVPLLLLNGILALYVASGQFQRRAGAALWCYLLLAPVFILWKLMLYAQMLCSQAPAVWTRTPRKAEQRQYKEGVKHGPH